ncbi:hypothetical protein PUN28_007848 [Cardiocondyla obscurior]|uniref:Uncharacterized protein n=1 Tax=Cardiocondyla obscurior TaxID=286306 RepID=A0AAW2G0Z0_9HYME
MYNLQLNRTVLLVSILSRPSPIEKSLSKSERLRQVHEERSLPRDTVKYTRSHQPTMHVRAGEHETRIAAFAAIPPISGGIYRLLRLVRPRTRSHSTFDGAHSWRDGGKRAPYVEEQDSPIMPRQPIYFVPMNFVPRIESGASNSFRRESLTTVQKGEPSSLSLPAGVLFQSQLTF